MPRSSSEGNAALQDDVNGGRCLSSTGRAQTRVGGGKKRKSVEFFFFFKLKLCHTGLLPSRRKCEFLTSGQCTPMDSKHVVSKCSETDPSLTPKNYFLQVFSLRYSNPLCTVCVLLIQVLKLTCTCFHFWTIEQTADPPPFLGTKESTAFFPGHVLESLVDTESVSLLRAGHQGQAALPP